MLDKLSIIVEYSKSIGIEEIDVMFLKILERKVSSRNGHIENIEESTESAYFVRLLKDKKLISLRFNSFEDYREIIASSVNLVRYVPNDDCVGFFDSIKDSTRNLEIDLLGNGEFVCFDDLISDANKISEISMKGENIVNLETCIVSSKSIEKYILCTNGFKMHCRNFINSCYVNLIANDNNTNTLEQDYNFSTSKNRNVYLESFVDECVFRCNRKLGAKKLKSGKYNVIIERRAAREFIQHFIDAINGDLISKKSSFLVGLLGKKIFNDNINIYDDPLYESGLFCNHYDDEGRFISKLPIVENGVLKSYLLDTYNAKKLHLESNRGFNKAGIIRSDYTNLFVESLNVDSFENVVSERENVILVTDFIGMGVNISNGNYSRGISGNIVVNGTVSEAVSEITLSGNLLDMYRNIVLLDDSMYEDGISIPSIYVGELMISGE